MIPRPLHGLIWTAWAVLFGALYVRAFFGSSETETPAHPVHAPSIEEVTLDEPAPVEPDRPVEPERVPPPVPEPQREEPPDRAPVAEPRAELDLPAQRAPAPDLAPRPPEPPPQPETPPPASEPHAPSEPPLEPPQPALELASAPSSPSTASAPLEAPPASQPFVETYLMLANPEGLPALERDYDLVLLARDGEAWLRYRRSEGSLSFEPIQLVELLRTHPGLRYLVPSLDLAGRPTPYRAVLEAFARARRAPLERLQLFVALPAARSREIEAARAAARARLQQEQRWNGTLLVHFENGALRFEVR